MKRELIARHLQRSLLFSGSSTSELASFAEVARVQIVPEGQYVYRQGEASEIFYIIANGEAELVLDRGDGVTRIVGRIGVGGHFGETGILTAKPRSLAVRALCDLVVICFDKRYFRLGLLSNPSVHKRLDTALAERLRVAFQDQAGAGGGSEVEGRESDVDDVILFKEKTGSAMQLRRLLRQKKDDIRESKTAKKTQAVIDLFAKHNEPFLLTGEPGTGKTIIARQIHGQSVRSGGQYRLVDLRQYEPLSLEGELLGTKQDDFPFAHSSQSGLLEQTSGGTLVLSHVHLLGVDLQKKLLDILKKSVYCPVDSDHQIAMQSRIIFISDHSFEYLQETGKIITPLLTLFAERHFHVSPLRDHKEDLPRLVSHYLHRFSKEYGKNIHRLNSETLGVLMNYDWPGNLTELANVIRRAVMLAPGGEILPDQILFGLPKTEGKWEYNILRIGWVNRLLKSGMFPKVPQILVGSILFITVLFLFLGPDNPESNGGLTLGWSIGWPLMFFSFFFLARTWCSVCTLAVPGTLLQNIVKPRRRTPRFIADYSGWIMATLCIIVFWVEIVWDAYNKPYLTGGIILIITFGSIVSSVLFSRRTWCRYLCPLGAVNAIFSMPSIVELRSNRHVCLNRCRSHSCFVGDVDIPGCPMFRHPYLVDNNRDCIMCAKCIKNCDHSSIQLNIRLAPQELWALETPRSADSFLIVSMGAIFFPFALQHSFAEFVERTVFRLAQLGLDLPYFVVGSIVFFAIILLFQVGYYLMVVGQSLYAKMDRKLLLPLFGYGFIPLILGGYMAVHLEVFISGAGRIVANIQELSGMSVSYDDIRLLSVDSTYVLQVLTVMGGLLASLYATYRVIERVLSEVPVTSKALVFPFSFLVVLAGLFVFMV